MHATSIPLYDPQYPGCLGSNTAGQDARITGSEHVLKALRGMEPGFLWLCSRRSFEPVWAAGPGGVRIAAYLPFHSELGRVIITEKEYRRIRKAWRQGRPGRLKEHRIPLLSVKAAISADGGRAGEEYHYFLSMDARPFRFDACATRLYHPDDFCWGRSFRELLAWFVHRGHLMSGPSRLRRWEDMDNPELLQWHGRWKVMEELAGDPTHDRTALSGIPASFL